jgi:hypothetical protein
MLTLILAVCLPVLTPLLLALFYFIWQKRAKTRAVSLRLQDHEKTETEANLPSSLPTLAHSEEDLQSPSKLLGSDLKPRKSTFFRDNSVDAIDAIELSANIT